MEIAALVLGIIALLLSFTGIFGWMGSVCGILAIIFGALGMKENSPNKGKAQAGLILGIFSIIIGIIFTIACVAVLLLAA